MREEFTCLSLTCPRTPLEAKSPFELRVDLGKDVPETDVRAALATGDMGFLHSFTTGATVDGPGVRVVAWTAGCMWRCRYCHNPDTWTMSNGMPVTVARATEELRKYRHGLKIMSGGLTLSGGEPLMQHRFVVKLFSRGEGDGRPHRARHQRLLRRQADRRRARGDRSGAARHQDVGSGAPPARSPAWTSAPTLAFARRLAARRRPVWLRYVLVPGLTDDLEDIGKIAELRRRPRQRRARRRAAVPPVGQVQVGSSSASRIRSRTPSRPTDDSIERALRRLPRRRIEAAY